MKHKTIFLDMDGVIANFHKRYFEICPEDSPDKFRRVVLEEKIFVDLELMPNAESLLWYLNYMQSKHGVRIELLTSTATKNIDQHNEAASQKSQWLEKHGIIWPVNYVPSGKDKAVFAHEHSMLIDDLSENCSWFREAGGSASIHHHSTYSQTCRDVNKFLFGT